jgi:hypothetical protein
MRRAAAAVGQIDDHRAQRDVPRVQSEAGRVQKVGEGARGDAWGGVVKIIGQLARNDSIKTDLLVSVTDDEWDLLRHLVGARDDEGGFTVTLKTVQAFNRFRSATRNAAEELGMLPKAGT